MSNRVSRGELAGGMRSEPRRTGRGNPHGAALLAHGLLPGHTSTGGAAILFSFNRLCRPLQKDATARALLDTPLFDNVPVSGPVRQNILATRERHAGDAI